MATLASLRQALGKAVDELPDLAGTKDFAEAEKAIDALERQIADLERAQRRSAALARPAGATGSLGAVDETNPMERTLTQIRAMEPARGKLRGFDDYLALARKGLEFTPARDTHYRSLGEQLQSIARYYLGKGTDMDPRLVRAPTGASEVDPTGGGFLVQVDFAAAIFMLAHDMGHLLAEVNKIPISAGSNGLKIPGVDETSRATGSRWGGVTSTWIGEGTTVTPSRPKFRIVEFDLKKMMSLMYVTDELLQDSTALTGIASQAFAEEIVWMTEDAIFEGSGAGMPLGIMGSGAKIAVAKDSGQLTGTFTASNAMNMWSRLWARSMSNAKWYMQQDVLPQLMGMSVGVSTAGGQLVYMPPGGLSGAPYGTLMGREVIFTEYANALSTEGDVMLADLSQYTLVDKNGVQAATSVHVAFNTDEMVFRITYRVDGKPMWYLPLTPAKGATKSPFITLATR
jgi:HK97 family phage major capsid protein